MSDGRLTWQAGVYLERSNPIRWSSLGWSANFLSCTDVLSLTPTRW